MLVEAERKDGKYKAGLGRYMINHVARKRKRAFTVQHIISYSSFPGYMDQESWLSTIKSHSCSAACAIAICKSLLLLSALLLKASMRHHQTAIHMVSSAMLSLQHTLASLASTHHASEVVWLDPLMGPSPLSSAWRRAAGTTRCTVGTSPLQASQTGPRLDEKSCPYVAVPPEQQQHGRERRRDGQQTMLPPARRRRRRRSAVPSQQPMQPPGQHRHHQHRLLRRVLDLLQHRRQV